MARIIPCIPIELSRAPRAFDAKASLWHRDFDRIYDLLRKHINKVAFESQAKPEINEINVNNIKRFPVLSIGIFGPSGCGKSSFLRTLASWVNDEDGFMKNIRKRESEHYKEDGSHGELKGRIHSLPVFDPTIWGAEDHFLYAFLAAALEAVKEKRERNDLEAESAVLLPVEQDFQEVSEYLRVIDQPDKTQEYDPLGVSLERLQRHTSHLRLRKHITKMISHLAQELNHGDKTPLVLLPVDDIDMAPDHLLPTLQSYHAYLVHPQLVPIFTFTDRMAEELLARNFKKSISPDSKKRIALVREEAVTLKPDVEGQRLDVNEQLAVQYLARCFPVRNRIRLGPAPARLQVADYSLDTAMGDRKVLELLVTASFLLLGHPDRDSEHNVGAALRPSTLRRQFQVIDAMLDSGVDQFIVGQFEVMAKKKRAHRGELENERDNREIKEQLSDWSQVFNRAAWSLLNIHRDVLRELDLHLEDLYSWTPTELRSCVLDTILAQDLETRRTLLKRWLYRTDDRRSEVFSLLAAHIFRPWLPGEPALGDEQVALFMERRDKGKGEESHARRPDCTLAFPATSGIVWFINLVIGFYLPQILARNRPNDIAMKDSVKGRITGIGWEFRNGPINAIRAADTNQNIVSSGMMFLEREKYSTVLAPDEQVREEIKSIEEDLDNKIKILSEKIKKTGAKGRKLAKDKRDLAVKRREKREFQRNRLRPIEDTILLRIWCFHGYSRGRFWAAVSIWRGLGLIGQLLAVYDSWENYSVPCSDNESENKKEQQQKEIRGIINTHIFHGMVPGPKLGMTRRLGDSPQDDINRAEADLANAFKGWNPLPGREEGDALNALVDRILDWFKEIERSNDPLLRPMPTSALEPDGSNTRDWIEWRDCFIRRLHGRYILGGFWSRLDGAYLEEQKIQQSDHKWTAGIALRSWVNTLLEYWLKPEPTHRNKFQVNENSPNCSKVVRILKACPILEPFVGLDPDELDGEYKECLLASLRPDSERAEREGKRKLTIAKLFFEIKRSKLEEFIVEIPESRK